jgi:hypothetical protein
MLIHIRIYNSHCFVPNFVMAKHSSKTTIKKKNPAAVALGRLGGLKGGPARIANLSAKGRSELARKASLARWSKKEK